MSWSEKGATPLLNVADVARSIAFYEALGFAVTDRFDQDGQAIWAHLSLGEARLMLNQQTRIDAASRRERPSYGDLVLYVYVESCAAARDALIATGWDVGPVERQDYGLDECLLRDPDGYEIALASPVDGS